MTTAKTPFMLQGGLWNVYRVFGGRAVTLIVSFSLFTLTLSISQAPAATVVVSPSGAHPAEICESRLLARENRKAIGLHPGIVDRDLRIYGMGFGTKFQAALEALSSGGRWVDFGAGEARAQLDYLQIRASKSDRKRGLLSHFLGTPSPQVVAIGYRHFQDASYAHSQGKTEAYDELRRQFQAQERFVYLEGRLVEEISDEEIGPFDLGTDYFGALTYTLDLTATVNKYLRLLHRPAVSRMFFVTSDSERAATYIETRDGRRLSLAAWLTAQPGLNVETLKLSPDGHEDFYMLTKVRDDVRVPEVELVSARRNNRDVVIWRLFREK
jgi:hypothetical protein